MSLMIDVMTYDIIHHDATQGPGYMASYMMTCMYVFLALTPTKVLMCPLCTLLFRLLSLFAPLRILMALAALLST